MSVPRKYPEELRVRAVRLYRDSDRSRRGPSSPRSWGCTRRRCAFGSAGAGERTDRPASDMIEENKQLRKKIADLERVNAVLRSASAYFASELDQTRR